MTQNSVNFSSQRKQDSRCCINFPHDLTSQILTNQSIKIGRRACSTRDHGQKDKRAKVTFVLTFVTALKGRHRADIVCECNSLKNFDICGGIERVSSHGYRARIQFPQKFFLLCDKQVIASALGQLRINFTPYFQNTLEINS